jgi:predicted AlkP superfamily phosphohydrolase/phosphomutase
VVALALLTGCGKQQHRKVIVLGVDGMDPGFVERHWRDLPHLDQLRREGSFQRLATTTPPQSPVAWSTFITGLDPAEHGIFDFVHRDPVTHEPFLSTDRTLPPRFTLWAGPYRLPLSSPRIESLRKGKPFWQTLDERGVPVTILRMPVNYPPLPYGKELAGMGTPDLRGTQGTFSFYTDGSEETTRPVSGGLIRKVEVVAHHVALQVEGPPNTLRKDGGYATVTLDVDVDQERAVARVAAGEEVAIVRQGEWSPWLPADFPLVPRLASARGMFRVYAKQLHPGFEVYVTPVNIDPLKAALPIAHPASFASGMGRFYTQGIGEDTAALRQGVFTHDEFLTQSRLVLNDEMQLLRRMLDGFRDGFLFFYFCSVDQNSHILWGKYEAQLLQFYRAMDNAVGEVRRREPDADLMVMSDHGFSSFERAVNLNTWLLGQGLLARDAGGAVDWAYTKAWAIGLNALYLKGADREDVRQRLLALRDPENGAVVVETVTEIRPAEGNRAVAPDLVVGYAPGYRASWQTGLGEVPDVVFETNTDAWIADHCIDAARVPGVLFLSRGLAAPAPSLKKLSGVILSLY